MKLTGDTLSELPDWAPTLDYDIRLALPWWAQLMMGFTPGAVALTIGRTVYIRPGHYMPATPGGLAIIAHELCHVRQWQDLGAVRFAWRYLWEFMRHGYYGISLEREAYALQSEIAERLEKRA